MAGDGGDVVDGLIKSALIAIGRLAGSADFANELERRGGYFLPGCRRRLLAKDFDPAAHFSSIVPCRHLSFAYGLLTVRVMVFFPAFPVTE